MLANPKAAPAIRPGLTVIRTQHRNSGSTTLTLTPTEATPPTVTSSSRESPDFRLVVTGGGVCPSDRRIMGSSRKEPQK
jgi:hypothetical protein